MNTDQNSKEEVSKKQLKSRILLTLALCTFGITLLNILNLETAGWAMNGTYSHFFRGSIFSIVVVIGIWLIRKHYPENDPKIGYRRPLVALKTMGFGIGLILIPLVITIIVTASSGWSTVTINGTGPFLYTFMIGFVATMLTDGLPEEVLFRGMIYSNLNVSYSKLKSSIISVILFALFPFLIVAIQKLLGLGVFIGMNDELTPGFMITMIFFGSFMQYLRVLTNSVWTSIGFHTLFVFMNQLVGIEPHNLIQFSGFQNERSMQITLITLLVLTFIGLLSYPRLAKKPIDWKANMKSV